MKKTLLSLWPFLLPVLLFLLLAGYGVGTQYMAEEKTPELYYRPAIMYNDQYYLTTSGQSFRNLDKASLSCVGVLTEDVTIHTLPTENMQSCGCEHLVGGNIYTSEEHPAYLFMYDEGDALHAFVLESER